MELTDIERALIEEQISTDTKWCYQCALQHAKVSPAEGIYAVGPNRIESCARCMREQQLIGVAIDSWTPIQQPAYIALLRQLMGQK